MSCTAVQDTAVGRVLPFSQGAPGINTPIPIDGSEAPLKLYSYGTATAGASAATCTDAATGEAIGAATCAAGPAGAHVETAARVRARRRLKKM